MRVGRLHHPKALDLPQRWRLQPRAGLYLRHRRQCRSPAGKRIHGQPLVGGALWPEIGSGGQCGYRSRPLRRAARDGGPGGERLCGYIIAISTGFPASVTRKILWKCPMSYKNTTASTDDCSTKHPAANHGSPPGALRYEKVKLLCPVVQQIQTEGKTQKEGELELKSERAVKDLLCRARYKQAKTIPKQQERKPARTFLQPRAYPVKDWRGAAQAAPLLTKTLYSYFCWAFLVLSAQIGAVQRRGAVFHTMVYAIKIVNATVNPEGGISPGGVYFFTKGGAETP